MRLIAVHKPQACILFINHGKPFYFPFLLFLKMIKSKAITWTHAVDLQRKHSGMSSLLHHLEHALCQGIILYAEPLRIYVAKSHRKKVFVANNTLNFLGYKPRPMDKAIILKQHGIATAKNIIFVGRLHKRKRIQDLVKAFELLDDLGCGLVLVGPDEEGLASTLAKKNPRILITGPLYGTDVLDLLSACDVYCMPGAIGLSVVDAMYCGLPVVTERLDHGPEIMYLRDGVNGLLAEKGDFQGLAERLRLLLQDEELRLQFSRKAREEIETNGHIDNLGRGFLQCLDHLLEPDPIGQPSRSGHD
jgi:glycosyltransferase involved in cell wall biosynthesis